MALSRCCGVPVVVDVRSDGSNSTDDDYDLKVPYVVCPKCGAVLMTLKDQGGEIEDAASESDGEQSES